ncbi:MAG TPA: phosphate ABC transporter substrate-binding protein PstS, partial [Tepidisphaeraceae bacterium]|nr:phosphate ABC transporter substrate-binding protein PstS [Tepidisphaeraceae bacterium]
MIGTMMKRSAVAALAAGLGFVGSVQAEVRLQGAGATFPNPVYQRWVSEYQKSNPDVKIDYQSIGSGGGIKGITEKTVDFAGSDAPLSKKEKAAVEGEIVHIPTVAGAVVAAYNLPGFSGELKLSGPVLADIFQGKITNWNDPKIASLNGGAGLPDMAITPAYRTDGSGTTFVFTNYLATQSEEYKGSVGMGKSVKWPTGQGGKGNEGVTAIVQSTPGSIGYVELNYATANNIPFALLQNKAGKFVKASPETVSNAGTGAVEQMEKSLAVDIWNQPGDEAYPIAAFTYILVYKDLGYLKDENKAKALVSFLKWATTGEGQQVAATLDYAPLAKPVQGKVTEAINSLT